MRIQLTTLALAALLPFSALQAAETAKQPDAKAQQQELRQNYSGPRLNQEQRDKMQEMRQAHRQEQQKLYQQTWEKIPKKDRDAYDKKREQMLEKNRSQMRAILTPEQQKAFDQMREQKLERQKQNIGRVGQGKAGKNRQKNQYKMHRQYRDCDIY